MNPYRGLAGTALLALAIAACSSGSSSSAAQSSSPEPTAVVTPTPEPSQGEGGGPSFAPGAGQLEGILPDEVGGIALDYKFAEGQGILGSEGMTPEIQDFLDAVGGNIDGTAMAFAFGFDQGTEKFITVLAIRVAGADEGRLRDKFRAVMERDSDAQFTEQNVGGKDVLAFASSGTEADTFMYVKGDIVFLVGSSPVDLAEEALSGLP